jgi:RNA polymerase sigma factor (sigma-70 family)
MRSWSRSAQDNGDKEACEYLLYKYRNLVRAKVKSYFLMGAERDDLLQIGMVGLWEAINDFRADRHTSFACFAKVCIQRQMISAVKAATRQKQVPLNSSISLEAAPGGDDDDERSLSEVLTAVPQMDPRPRCSVSKGSACSKSRCASTSPRSNGRFSRNTAPANHTRRWPPRWAARSSPSTTHSPVSGASSPRVAPEQAARLGSALTPQLGAQHMPLTPTVGRVGSDPPLSHDPAVIADGG